MKKDRAVSHLEHPLTLGSLASWIRLLRACDGIDRDFLPRLVFVSLTTLLTAPLRRVEEACYGRRIQRVRIHPSPVFIVGHWRTGTTHLHNLLCLDRTLGFVSTFQAMAPGFCLMGQRGIKPLLSRIARKRHPTREIDNIPLSLDAPQEEDFALANLCPYSFLHQYTFPRQAPHFFDRYALFEDLPAEVLAEWSGIYLDLLRKATLLAGGKRLLLKNPANSGRIGVLLGLFPDARFIHICRNPYEVFRSTLHLYRTVLSWSQLQTIDAERVEQYVLTFYAKLMRKYLAEKERIPAGSLVEVRYEDLESSPLLELRRIYEGLGLPGFERAEPAFRSYLASVAGYQKNAYTIDGAVIEKVNRHWRFAFDAWGYPLREPGS